MSVDGLSVSKMRLCCLDSGRWLLSHRLRRHCNNKHVDYAIVIISSKLYFANEVSIIYMQFYL